MSDELPPSGLPPYGPPPGPPAGEPPVSPPVSPPVAAPAAPPAYPAVPVPPRPAPPADHRRRGLGIVGTVLVAALVAAVVGAFAGLAGYVVGRNVDANADQGTGTAVVSQQSTTSGTPAVTPVAPLVDGSVADIAASTLPSVVSILAEGTSQSGSGSGFVIRSGGYILTNNHVVDLVADGGTLTVVFNDGKRLPGKVVGTSPTYDLAVVKVDRSGLPTVNLGDSTQVRVGDVAIAIGAPLGLDGTVTSGIISAVDRPVTAGEQADPAYINAIQTDAAINPGNSGGPLLNAAGAVIGVNSAIATLAQGAETGSIGLGFAIPSNSAKRVAQELITTGSSHTPLMGVQLDLNYTDAGARVESVTAGSGADTAGLKPGDIIVTVNGRSIDDATELVVAIRSYAPGDTVKVGYTRNGQQRSAALVLGDDAAKS
jgi:putative serine protease PepD